MNSDRLYIDGAWVPSTGTDTIEVVDPSSDFFKYLKSPGRGKQSAP